MKFLDDGDPDSEEEFNSEEEADATEAGENSIQNNVNEMSLGGEALRDYRKNKKSQASQSSQGSQSSQSTQVPQSTEASQSSQASPSTSNLSDIRRERELEQIRCARA